MKKIVITSGYFNPIHIGHINLLREAKKLGDFLIVIVNNDKQVKIKGNVPFMREKERMEIIKAIKYVDEVFLSIDKDETVCKSLETIFKKYNNKGQFYFVKGGDRNVNNIPECEKTVCKENSAQIISGVGGKKVQSSSMLLGNVIKFYKKECQKILKILKSR